MFKKAEVKERVWEFKEGWGVIKGFIECEKSKRLKVLFDNSKTKSYELDGRESTEDVSPVLFWGEVKFDSLPIKIYRPFDLKEEYSKLKTSEYSGDVYMLEYFNSTQKWFCVLNWRGELVGCKYYKKENLEEFVRLLNVNLVTPNELNQVIRKVEKERKKFKIGDRVNHNVYGLGTVNSLSSVNINRFGVTFDCGVWESFSMDSNEVIKVDKQNKEEI